MLAQDLYQAERDRNTNEFDTDDKKCEKRGTEFINC